MAATIEHIALWECFECVFRTRERYTNPFTDVRIEVELLHGDRRITVDGFFDGEEAGWSVFRFRFAPMHRGRWSFTVRSNEPSLDGTTGGFEAVDPVSRGGLVTSRRFPNWFFRQDGEAELVINDGWTPHPGSSYGAPELGPQHFPCPSEEQYRTYVDVLARHGVNMFVDLRQLYARQDSISDPSFLWPWHVVDAKTNRIDRERFNLSYFQRLDRQLAHARANGLFYGVELLYDNSTFRRAEWAHHPYNERNGGWIEDWDGAPDDYTKDQLPFGWSVRRIFDLDNLVHRSYLKRYLSYAVARTSAFWNVFYALGCESSNLYPGEAERIDAWFTYWGDFIARKDPHGRLCTLGDVAAHNRRAWNELTGHSAFVFQNARNNLIVSQEHSLTDDPDEFVDAISRFGERFWRFRRPTVIGEQDGRNCRKYDKERRAYWAAIVSGFMMGRVDRHFALADGKRLRESTLFSLDGDPPIYRYLEHLRSFVEQSGLPFWRLEPSDRLIRSSRSGTHCLAEEEEWYVLYFAAGGEAVVDLPDAAYAAQWFNPREGNFRGEPDSVRGSALRFEAPDSEDWTLLIKRMT